VYQLNPYFVITTENHNSSDKKLYQNVERNLSIKKKMGCFNFLRTGLDTYGFSTTDFMAAERYMAGRNGYLGLDNIKSVWK